FAAAKHGRTHRTVVAVNWDAWQEVGMAADTLVPADMKESWKKHLAEGIKPADGVEAFLRVLHAGLPQVAVITRDLIEILEREAIRDGQVRGSGRTVEAEGARAVTTNPALPANAD